MIGQRRTSLCDATRPNRVIIGVTGADKVVILGISNDASLTCRRLVAVISIRARSVIRRNTASDAFQFLGGELASTPYVMAVEATTFSTAPRQNAKSCKTGIGVKMTGQACASF